MKVETTDWRLTCARCGKGLDFSEGYYLQGKHIVCQDCGIYLAETTLTDKQVAWLFAIAIVIIFFLIWSIQ